MLVPAYQVSHLSLVPLTQISYGKIIITSLDLGLNKTILQVLFSMQDLIMAKSTRALYNWKVPIVFISVFDAIFYTNTGK